MEIKTHRERLGSALRDLLSNLTAYGSEMPEDLQIDLRQKVRECLASIDEPESINVTVGVNLNFPFQQPPPGGKD